MKPSRIPAPRALAVLAAMLVTSGLSFAAGADVPDAATPAATAATTTAPAATAPAPGEPTAAANPAPAASTTAAPAASTAKPKLICEDDEQIGSHFRKRVCLTPEQVEARKKAARDMFQHGQVNSCNENGCNGSPLGGPPMKR